MRKKIEGVYPLIDVNQLAMAERVTKKHPGNIHLWWNRSPLESSALVLKAVLEDDLYEAGGKQENSLSNVTIVDPFSGSGCLSLAAMSSEMPVMAGDLNSVACLITKAVSEYPARFNNIQPASSDADIHLYSGLTGLAEDVRCYGNWLREELYHRVSEYYPDASQNSGSRQVYAWVWTRTAPCPNPACGCRIPLASSFVLSRQKNREFHVEPIIKNDQIMFDVLPGAPASSLNGNKIGKQGAQFQCPKCGSITKDEYVKAAGKTGTLGIQLMAVAYISDEGKTYLSADENQLKAAECKCKDELPFGRIPDNSRWFSPPLFGLHSYSDIFTPRQLTLMTSLCELIGEAKELCRKDALAAGMQDDTITLEAGGTGALAYSQAVGIYLSLVVGKLANFQSEICTWDNRNGNVRAAFTRQAIPMTWTFAEGNPFSTVTGNFNSMLADVVSVISHLSIHSSAKVAQTDALKYPFPENSLLFTELPYYDNVGYADLSDYFYIWLRLCLKEQLPELFDQVVSSKEELSSIPEHFGCESLLAEKAYVEGLHEFFMHFHRFTACDYPSVVFFEFGKQDEKALSGVSEIGRSFSRWENIIDALLQAGFHITATLPIRSEKPNDSYETTRVAIVFRPKGMDARKTIRRLAIAELKRELPALLEKHLSAGMDPLDYPIVGMGCALSLFSRYASIMNADGSTMDTRDIMQIIWTEVTEYIQNADLKEIITIQEETING